MIEIIHASYGNKKGFSQLFYRMKITEDVDMQNRSVTFYYVRGTLLVYEK